MRDSFKPRTPYDPYRRGMFLVTGGLGMIGAHTGTVLTQSGVYFGTFFCMNFGCPGRIRITDNGRSRNSGRIRSCTASR